MSHDDLSFGTAPESHAVDEAYWAALADDDTTGEPPLTRAEVAEVAAEYPVLDWHAEFAKHGRQPEAPDDHGNPRLNHLYAHLVDVDGLRNIPPPEPLVAGYLYRDSLAWLSGKPGHGKSFLAVDLACCVATGTRWHGQLTHPTSRGGRVLYLIAEGAAGLAARVDAWSLAHGRRVANVQFLPIPVQLLSYVDLAAFMDLVADLKPDLLIIDTQARVTVGGEENSSKDMGQFVDALERLRRASGACVLTVHHEARAGDNMRGSTALEGAATTILRASKDGQLVEITNPKQKDAPEQPALTLGLSEVGGSAVLSRQAVGAVSGAATESEMALLTVLRSFGTGGASKTELRDASGQSKTTYYRSVNALVSKGLVDECKQGKSTRYFPAMDGADQGELDV